MSPKTYIMTASRLRAGPPVRRAARLLPIALTISVLIHALLLLLSTNLYLMNNAELSRQVAQLFHVEVTRMIPEPRTIAPPPRPAPATIESIEHILEQEAVAEPAVLPQPADSADDVAEQIREKGQIEFIPREGPAGISPEAADTVDLKVVALARGAFAENLGPRRRQVGPGGGMVVPTAALPTWSVVGAAAQDRAERAESVAAAARETRRAADRPVEVAKELTRVEPELPELSGKLARSERSLPEAGLPEGVLPALEDRESVRKYEPLDDLLDIELYTYRPADGAGYFMVRIRPRTDTRLAVLPKDIVFVIDSSKSIGAAKLDEARSAVRECLEQLNPYDRFNVVAFSREPVFLSDGLIAASPANMTRATRFLRDIVSGGQTDVYGALQPLVRRMPRENIPYIILLFSDGKSTVGDLDSREIINQLTETNRRGARASIFAFGGGSSVNRYLLDLLALRNKGVSEVTRVVSRIDLDMPKFYGRLRDPILTDLTANYSGLDLTEIYPRRIPDFYLGTEIVTLGRFDTEREFSMRLTGVVNGTRKELVFRRLFADARPATADIVHRWASSKAYHIIEQICARGMMPELVTELDSLKTRYGVRTAYDQYGYSQ